MFFNNLKQIIPFSILQEETYPIGKKIVEHYHKASKSTPQSLMFVELLYILSEKRRKKVLKSLAIQF